MAAYTTIDNPELYFQTKLYTGNGSTNAITLDGDENMQADMVWIKDRGRSGYNHVLNDSVRGVTKYIRPNLDSDEDTYTDAITAFDSDGFTLGADSSNGEHNVSSQTYVAWCWKESVTAGFDIVTYTGSGSPQNISHSLSAVPEFFPTKRRSGTNQWRTYHVGASDGATDYANLDTTDAFSDSATIFNDTMPTSSVYTVSTDSGINGSSETYVTYLFTGKQGYSKFSKYTGNGNADGPFIYTGFRPAWLLLKKSSASGNTWQIFDNKRDTGNPLDNTLETTNSAEATGTDRLDFTAQGFKIRTSGSAQNASGATFVYAAFAEQPFVNSSGVPANAR